MMSIDEVKGKIKPDWRNCFSMDLTGDYYQVGLQENIKNLIIFIVPQGRFQFKIPPMGMNTSSEYFNAATRML